MFESLSFAHFGVYKCFDFCVGFVFVVVCARLSSSRLFSSFLWFYEYGANMSVFVCVGCIIVGGRVESRFIMCERIRSRRFDLAESVLCVCAVNLKYV